jgi:Zn-dependent metalloprotease
MRCHFIPGYLLDHLAQDSDEAVAERGRRTHAIDQELRARPAAAPPLATGDAWEIHDAQNGSTLPGRRVRSAGQPDSGDVAVDEAATGITESLALFTDFGRDSYDDHGATVVATVHYEQDYDNAFWDGTQLVFGDGDGQVFDRFTKPIDVLGHELSHAVTQFTADLTSEGQSGALNESMSDVFGACIKQRHLGQDAASADWLVGEGIFLPGINGKALRSMSDPGTAYDDPQIGKDPQVGSMADYVDTTDDNGGVHLNSGIPNRAFVLAARAIGGDSWSGAGKIWYAALTSGIPADTDFAAFAEATVAAAGDQAGAVRSAWDTVGVGSSTPSPAEPSPGGSSVDVRRTGGFAGLRKEGSVDLDSDDPRVPEVRSLVDRIDFSAVDGGRPAPDRFVYSFRYDRSECVVHEPALTPDLASLARLVLGE